MDLDKLLPQDKSVNGFSMEDEHPNRLELIHEGNHAYMVPYQERGNRVNGLHKWDQAFRIYAAIYSEPNLQRAGEIWQYIHTIHTAAANYSWESVVFYDFMFRQLMASKPWRNWGKTYSQEWNLTLKASGPSGRNHGHNNQGAGVSGPQSASKVKDWCDNCCWHFSCNKCENQDCNFDHRCHYCGDWNHGYYNCWKRLPGQSVDSWDPVRSSSRSDPVGNGDKHDKHAQK